MSKFINKPETTKTNFKMYKDGKHWVFAGLMLLSLPMALMGSLEVSAAETEKKAISATATSDDEADTIKTASIESPKVVTNTTTNDVKTSEKTVSEVKPETTSSIEEKTTVSKLETKPEATSSIEEKTAVSKLETKPEVTTEVKEVTSKSDASSEVMTEEEEKANAEAAKDVEPSLASETYIKQINDLTNLTAAQKKYYVDAINSYTIADKFNPLKSRDWYVAQAKALDNVMTNKNLTAADIKTFEAQIANAGTGLLGGILEGQEKLDTIVSRAKAVQTIRTTDNLISTDITALVKEASAAPTSTGSTIAINKAKSVSTMRVRTDLLDEDKNEFAKQIIAGDVLATKRADAVAKIRGNKSLTTDDQKNLVEQVLKGTKAADIDLVNKKVAEATAIRENKGLDQSDQDALIDLILKATSDDAVNVANRKVREMAKVRSTLNNLTDAEKNQLNKAITNAPENMISELANKAAAMNEIRGRKITDSEKNTLNEGVFKAVKDSGSLILGWGKVTVEDQLNAAKGKATMVEEVRAKKNLTQPEKERIAKTIMESGSKELADFEMERAKFMDDLRGMGTLTGPGSFSQ